MILAGLSGIIVVEIYAAIMQKEFQDSDNNVGKGFAVLGIYLFVVTYCTWIAIFPGSVPVTLMSALAHLLTSSFVQMAC